MERARGWLIRLLPERRAWQDAEVPGLWIARLLISDRTAEKIITVHGIHPDDVRAAVVFVAGLRFSWDNRRDRGRRAIVKTRINEKPALVVLYVAESGWDEWWLASAYYTGD